MSDPATADLQTLQDQGLSELQACPDEAALRAWNTKHFGDKGLVKAALAKIGSVPKDQRAGHRCFQQQVAAGLEEESAAGFESNDAFHLNDHDLGHERGGGAAPNPSGRVADNRGAADPDLVAAARGCLVLEDTGGLEAGVEPDQPVEPKLRQELKLVAVSVSTVASAESVFLDAGADNVCDDASHCDGLADTEPVGADDRADAAGAAARQVGMTPACPVPNVEADGGAVSDNVEVPECCAEQP